MPGFIGMFIAGLVISSVSAFAAIGGAFMTIPFLMYCNVPLLQAIGTAAAVGFPIALAGSVGFIATGWGVAGLPEPHLGFVYLPALAGIVHPEHAARAGRRGGGAQTAHQAAAADLRGVALRVRDADADLPALIRPASPQAFFSASSTRSGVSGMRRIRTPVALKNALASAGASGGTPSSPMPPIFSVLFTA